MDLPATMLMLKPFGQRFRGRPAIVAMTAMALLVAGCMAGPSSPAAPAKPPPARDTEWKEAFDQAFWNQADAPWSVACAFWDEDDPEHVLDRFLIVPHKVTLHVMPEVNYPNATMATCAAGPQGADLVAENATNRFFWDCTDDATFCWRENTWHKRNRSNYYYQSWRLWIADSNGSLVRVWYTPEWSNVPWVRG